MLKYFQDGFDVCGNKTKTNFLWLDYALSLSIWISFSTNMKIYKDIEISNVYSGETGPRDVGILQLV